MTYVYTKNPTVGADVIVQYQDTKGNTISPNIIKTGNIEDSYITEKFTIEGYTYKEVIGNSMRTFITDPQTAIYVYTKNDNKKSIKPSESGTIPNSVGQRKPNNSNIYTKGLAETGKKNSILFMILGITTLVVGAYIFNKKLVNNN
ncbi:hypothetical protein BCR22_11930 [Enterococcus plantarum]|nr:hypothetical protein BCR22_11930 [Enterococcus plantarum]